MFEDSRQTYIAANKLDTEDPEPLYEFYRPICARAFTRPTMRIEALHYASDLAPQDIGVRMNSAIAYLKQGKPRMRARPSRWSLIRRIRTRRPSLRSG